MAWRTMPIASASSILGLRRSPSEVGKRMQPKPSAETCQSSFPKLRYCMVLPPLCQAGFYSGAGNSILSPFFWRNGGWPQTSIQEVLEGRGLSRRRHSAQQPLHQRLPLILQRCPVKLPPRPLIPVVCVRGCALLAVQVGVDGHALHALKLVHQPVRLDPIPFCVPPQSSQRSRQPLRRYFVCHRCAELLYMHRVLLSFSSSASQGVRMSPICVICITPRIHFS